MSHVAGNKYMDVFTLISMQFWVSYEMKKWGVRKLFEAKHMVPSTRATLQITSAFLGMFQEKIWSSPENSKMFKEQPKLKVIIHAFRLSRSPSSEPHEITTRNMVGHWKEVMWLGTNIWMSLCSFRVNFRFHEIRKNGVLRGFSRQCKWCHAPAQRYKSRRHS